MLKIYGVPISVHTRKVIVAAIAKGLAHEVVPVVPVVPGNPPPNWRELSPTGLIPALVDGDFTLADSFEQNTPCAARSSSSRLSAVVFASPAGAGSRVNIDQVRDMAFARGIELIEEIELDDGIWEVEGRDAAGHKVKMDVEASSGEVVRMKRR